MIYTLTLNPSLDYTLEVDVLNGGKTNRARSDKLSYGGKGINVSVILAELNVKSTALGFAAGFTGAELERILKEKGINCGFVHLDSGNTRINVKIISDKEYEINASGPTVSDGDLAFLFNRLDEISDYDWLVISGSVPGGMNNGIYAKILERLKYRKIKTVVDAQGDLLLNTLKYKPFLVKPNVFELSELFDAKITTEEEIEFYAKKLQAFGAKNVLVSRGKNGAVLICESGEIIKTKSAEGVQINSVGSGDSMVAGFIAEYLKFSDFSRALKFGTACGAATAFSEGLADKRKINEVFASFNE